MPENFQIKFTWDNKQRQVSIRSTDLADRDYSVSVYQVFRNNIHLFSLYPVINSESRKGWEVLEKDREAHIPQEFLNALGYMIDGYYVSKN